MLEKSLTFNVAFAKDALSPCNQDNTEELHAIAA
jgi:hypothetical protein